MAQTIYKGIGGLSSFPNFGRIGIAENIRELIFGSYIAVYEIIDNQVLRIRHAAQDWP